ncbi:MAG: GNAT family N-acetyltransferase [Candidatus Kaistia colombiensis]|nr:MAG: GNAT family N-acetyltransferase [Kaistia sp.]
MPISIRSITEADIPGFRVAVDSVARERRYLALLEAGPMAQTAAFVLGNIEKGNPTFVATDEDRVVGWCDIIRNERREIHRHRGALGIGIVAPYRHQGIGRRLMETAISAAWATGMTRIELDVRADNQNAIALYKRLGFEMEGTQRNAGWIDGSYHDVHSMALLARV